MILMGIYRLWYVRDAAGVRGPYPEALICRFILLGRLQRDDLVSLDRSVWCPAGDVPELKQSLHELLEAHGVPGDVRWSEERAKAALRWLDERKAPDPRGRSSEDAAPGHPEQRVGLERRQVPETLEQHAYKEGRGEVVSRWRQYHQRFGRTAAWLALAGVATVALLLLFEPVRPVEVGLRLGRVDCAAPASRGVRWSGCSKDGAQLAGVDLRAAELVGTSFRLASLADADLSAANLLHADLAGADLSRARLAGAVWVDGRICATGSIGRCR